MAEWTVKVDLSWRVSRFAFRAKNEEWSDLQLVSQIIFASPKQFAQRIDTLNN